MGMMGPFGEEVYQMLAGLGHPSAPGIHGVIEIEKPKPEALEFVTKVRDMCDEFIRCYGKENCEEGDGDELQGRGDEGGSEGEGEGWKPGSGEEGAPSEKGKR